MYACGRMVVADSLRLIPMPGLGKIRSEGFARSSLNYVVRNTLPREGRMLKKLMVGARKKLYDAAPKWIEKPTIGDSKFLKPKETKNPRRVTVLNSVLMEAITDVMASGEICPELSGLGIEISRLKVTADYSIVNVFWSCSRAVDGEKTEKLLKSFAGPIRSYLCTHHVLGNVPYVCFVKDKLQNNVNDVEQLLARADFGSDFMPHDPTHHQKSAYLLSRAVSPFPDIEGSLTENCDSGDADASISNAESSFNVPACVADPSVINLDMRMDILGLKHPDIMLHVVQNMSKARAEHRRFSVEGQLPCEPQPGNPSSTLPLNHDPAFTMSIRQFLEQKNRQKHMSRKEELVDMKNAQFMEDCKQGMNLDEPEEAENDFCDDDFFSEEELLDFDLEHSSEPPY